MQLRIHNRSNTSIKPLGLFGWLVVLLLWTIPELGLAARIDGPANVRMTPQKTVAFSLEDQVYVYAHEPENNWFYIMANVKVKLTDFIDDYTLAAGTVLYDHDFTTVVGTVKIDLNVGEYAMGDDENGFTSVMLFGYTYHSNIRPESILEREIERAVKSGSQAALNRLKGRFRFAEYTVEEYTVWTTYDRRDPWGSADFRMMLYFDKEMNLIGVANKGRKFEIPHLLESSIDRNYRMQYMIKLPEKERISFEKKVTEAFALRD